MATQERERGGILRVGAAAQTRVAGAFRAVDDIAQQRRANPATAVFRQHPHVEPWAADLERAGVPRQEGDADRLAVVLGDQLDRIDLERADEGTHLDGDRVRRSSVARRDPALQVVIAHDRTHLERHPTRGYRPSADGTSKAASGGVKGGSDGTRTRDLRRDRPVLAVPG